MEPDNSGFLFYKLINDIAPIIFDLFANDGYDRTEVLVFHAQHSFQITINYCSIGAQCVSGSILIE